MYVSTDRYPDESIQLFVFTISRAGLCVHNIICEGKAGRAGPAGRQAEMELRLNQNTNCSFLRMCVWNLAILTALRSSVDCCMHYIVFSLSAICRACKDLFKSDLRVTPRSRKANSIELAETGFFCFFVWCPLARKRRSTGVYNNRLDIFHTRATGVC